jgi:MFS family permease
MENPSPTNVVPRYSYYALAVLTLINFLNYIDRQVLPGVASLMTKDPHLRLTDTELGMLEGALLLSYTVLAPIFGRLGDRFSRTKLMAAAAVIWSLATGVVGFIDHLPFLPAAVALPFATVSGAAIAMALMRAVVGVGESSYATITPTLVADYFPARKRATALGVFQAAIPMGFALGFVIGGVLGAYFGWRVAFMMVGIPGLLMSVLVWKLKEPLRGGTDVDAHGDPLPPVDPDAPRESWFKVAWRILRTRDWLLSTAGYAALTSVLGAFASYAQLLLVRDKGMSDGAASVVLGVVILLGGAAGTFSGGWIADKVAARRKNGYWLVCAASCLLGFAPALVAVVSGNTYLYLPAIFLAVMFLFINNAPFHAILINSVPATIRASAVALNIVVIHAFGDLLTRTGVGFLSDTLKDGGLAPLASLAGLVGLNAQTQHLSAALLVAPAGLLLACAFFVIGAKQLNAEARTQ